MAAANAVNGTSASNTGSLSFAEQLQKKHQAGHNPTVEEVEDEDDRMHPPPSSLAAKPAPAPENTDPPLSEKAKGKQKAEEAPQGQEAQSKKAEQPLDTTSEELFPALGSGPRPRSTGQASAAWGSNKPASVGAKVNGPGSGAGANASAPRISTPLSSANNQNRTVQMPGRHTETVNFAPSQLMPRDKLKKPLPDLLRELNKRSKAKIEMKHVNNGEIAFIGTGPSVDVVQQALREVAKQAGAKVSCRMMQKQCSADTDVASRKDVRSGQCQTAHYRTSRCDGAKYHEGERGQYPGAKA